MLENIRKVFELIVRAERELGIKKILTYTAYILGVISIVNWKSITSEINNYVKDVNRIRHDKSLTIRHETDLKIYPLLVELRSRIGADRAIFLEFHNTVTNLMGIPFRFLTLSQHDESYHTGFNIDKYKSINSSVLTGFLSSLSVRSFLKVDDLDAFKIEYGTAYETLNNSDAKALCYMYLTGGDKPLGILILEWNRDQNYSIFDWNEIRNNITNTSMRINAIMVDSRNKIESLK